MTGIWLSENKYIDFAEAERPEVGAEIATRMNRMDWGGFFGYLPDPDPVLAKLGETVPVYRSLLSDAHVWSCFTSRAGGTLSNEWRLEPPSGGKRAGKAALADIEEILEKRLDMHQLITEMLYAPFFGMSPIEIVWAKEGAKWIPEKAEGKPPEWFVFGDENELRFVSSGTVSGEAVPPMKFLLPRHFASYQNPYGERLLSRCFWPVAFKKGGFKFWAIFTEKYGMPWLIGKVPRGTNETERARVLSNLAAMVQDAVAVINDDESVDIKEASGKSATADIYDRLIEASNKEISKAIVGQTLTTDVGSTGSYAASKTHMEVRGDLVDMDKRMCAGQIQQLIDWITLLNHPGAESPEFEWYEEEDFQNERAERDDKLYNQGVRFKQQYFERVYGFEPGDIEMTEDRAPDMTPGMNPGTAPGQSPQNGSIPPDESGDPASGKDEKSGSQDAQKATGGDFAEDATDDQGEAVLDEIEAMSVAAAKASAPLIEEMVSGLSAALDWEDLKARAKEIRLPDRYQEIVARAKFMAALTGGAFVADTEKFSAKIAENESRNPAETGDFADSFSATFADFADWDSLRIDFDMPFEEAVDYFRSKGIVLNLGTWREVWQEANAGAFTVARVTEADVLVDIFEAISKAQQTGSTLTQFLIELLPMLAEKGWLEGEDALTLSRLETIFRTNLAAAYNVGRYSQMIEVENRPYWQYMGVKDPSTRDEHRAMQGRVYRSDDPIWDTWYPPNGFRCRCYVRTLSDDEVRERGLAVDTQPPADPDGKPIAPDEGWRYHPGKAGLDSWGPILADYPPDVRGILKERLGI